MQPRDFKYIHCLSYGKFEAKSFQNDIDKVNLEEMCQLHDVNVAPIFFLDKFMEVGDRHAPLVRLKMRLHPPDWINGDYLAHTDERES